MNRFLWTTLVTALLTSSLGAEDKKPHIVFVTGDEEYRSEESMPFLAKILEKHHGFRTTVCYALDKDGTINPSRLDNISGLEALKDADMMVVFTRFRTLPDDQLKMILDFSNSGKPMAGFRTATHAFKYDGKSPNAKWNDAFGRDVFGQRWITHHGHEPGEFLTLVRPLAAQAKHPVLRGVTEFKVPSWLYHVDGGGDTLSGDSMPLLQGESLVSGHQKSSRTVRHPLSQPVAWVKTYGEKKARVFFTTLGHPHDFKSESFRKVVVNGIYWTLGKEKDIPEAGTKVDLLEEFKMTTAAFGGHIKGVKPPVASEK